ncbi:hypothetical protein AMS68_002819 [Peltaster fructicola]|uniref:XPG-I domain-containing protein n=1 Tax=Peltaster fructicola TaxID=286661 RepID=A0A6H0XRA8_9PEZI|nr:hypothetical protein AMS68_002819 [Peltaster fructicola]
MGIHGLFKHLGSGKRISLATLSAQHYAQHKQPFRLAIDISIWLFQIQAGQGGSNPAIRTFYYRLLRLISLNIHPLFVFDGPNKPLFKRNKRVGGPGVRVATVPEFFAKQLLKQFGFPMHIAPGEAEAECALLQREGLVDAVLSEDVDTIMFGSRLTLRNWTAEGSSKTPSHVNVYDEADILAESGLDQYGMVLVALMSGGDYIPEGIPRCGPKIAVDAAKAGFGRRLCMLNEKDTKQLADWREELQIEFRTNASKYFSRRNTTLVVPDDFPNFEVMGYYVSPCVSSLEKVAELRQKLHWDQPLDFPALRVFAEDAFEWQNRGGAIKFIRNLSQALLPQQLRLAAERGDCNNLDEQVERESAILQGVHNKRTHITTDNAMEMRVSYIPAKLVPIDLSSEPLGDDEQGEGEETETMADAPEVGASDDDDDIPQTPSRRKRTYRPYVEEQAEKIWVLREWVQLGCPAMLEDFDAQLRTKQKATKPSKTGVRKAKGTGKRGAPSSANSGMPVNALMRHIQATRSIAVPEADEEWKSSNSQTADATSIAFATSTLPSSRRSRTDVEAVCTATSRHSRAASSDEPEAPQRARFRLPQGIQEPRTPRKRRTAEISTPQSGRSAITHFFSPTTQKLQQSHPEVISLLSSSPSAPVEGRAPAPQPNEQTSARTLSSLYKDNASQELSQNLDSVIPDLTVKRRQPRVAMQKSLSMPLSQPFMTSVSTTFDSVECLDLAESPAQAQLLTLEASLRQPATNLYQAFSRMQSNVVARGEDLSLDLAVPSLDLSDPVVSIAPSTLRNEHTQSQTVSAVRKATSRKPEEQPKKSFIRIRESLDGAWTMATAETLDLSHVETSTTTAHATQSKRRQMGIWRASGIDTLDLTGE